MSSFNGLSSLLKGKILGYLEEFEYRRLRSVSRGWDACFRNEVGLGLKITNWNWDLLQYELKRSCKLASLNLSNMTLPLGQVLQLPMDVSLTSLSFYKITPSHNIIWCLKMFRNMRKLAFQLVLLESTEFKFNGSTLSLPTLESISIAMTTGSENPNGLDETMTVNSGHAIMEFISNIEYKNLKKVTLLCPEEVLIRLPFHQLGYPNYDLTEMPGMIRLLYANRKTVQQFLAGPTTKSALKWIFKPLNQFWRTPMNLIYFDSRIDFPNNWDILLQTQSLFQYIRVNGAYRHWESLLTAISRSYESVVEVCLVGGGFGSSVSLSGFKKCTKLRTLEIFLDDCYLENIQDLPISLRVLSLNGPLMEKDLQVIANRLENLEDLYVNGNLPSTKYEYYGKNFVLPGILTRSLVEDFLTLPIIQSLSFRNCRIEVPAVTSWLDTIDGIETEVYPVRGFPRDTTGSMSIQICSRKYVTNSIYNQ